MNTIEITRYTAAEMHEMCDYCKNNMPHIHYYGDLNGHLQAIATYNILKSDIPKDAKVRNEGKWIVGPRPGDTEELRKAFTVPDFSITENTP